MVENMMRGGVSSVYAKGHIKCNNNYLGNNDPREEETYGVLLGASDLGSQRFNLLKLSLFKPQKNYAAKVFNI